MKGKGNMKYFIKSRFFGWREVTEEQFARWCDHIRKNAVAMKPEERERHIQENTRIEK
jgi:hypothetical protein